VVHYPVPEWVHRQVYLHPHPKELMLHNHVQVACNWFEAGELNVLERFLTEMQFEPYNGHINELVAEERFSAKG
jgi:hypothetical protein